MRQNSCRRAASARRGAAVLSLTGMLLPFPGEADERKQLAFDTIDRNAGQIRWFVRDANMPDAKDTYESF